MGKLTLSSGWISAILMTTSHCRWHGFQKSTRSNWTKIWCNFIGFHWSRPAERPRVIPSFPIADLGFERKMDVILFNPFLGKRTIFLYTISFQMCWNATFFGSLHAPSNFHVYSVGGPLSHCESFKEIFVSQVGWKPLPRSFLYIKSKTLRNCFLDFDMAFRAHKLCKSEAVSMPGSWYPDERFQRIYLVKRGMPQPKNYQAGEMSKCHCWGLQGGRKILKRCWLGHPGIAGRMVLNVWLNLCWQTGIPTLILSFTVLKSCTVPIW